MIKLIDILNENTNSVLQKIADKVSSKLYCDIFGSCIHFAELFVLDVEKQDLSLLDTFYVIEGYVTTTAGKFEHTWIETKDGEKIDPTFKQFQGKILKITKRKKFTGEEYLKDTKKGTWFSQRRQDLPKTVFKKENLDPKTLKSTTNLKELSLEEQKILKYLLNEKCWKGYTQKGMKTMFGKKYPNCVKKTKKR